MDEASEIALLKERMAANERVIEKLMGGIAHANGSIVVIAVAVQQVIAALGALPAASAVPAAVFDELRGFIAHLHRTQRQAAYLDGADQASATIQSPPPTHRRGQP